MYVLYVLYVTLVVLGSGAPVALGSQVGKGVHGAAF